MNASGYGRGWPSFAASSARLNGLVRKSSMPAARHRSRSPGITFAVSAMIGTRVAVFSISRMLFVASSPSITGMDISMRMAKYFPGANALTASAPSAANSARSPRL